MMFRLLFVVLILAGHSILHAQTERRLVVSAARTYFESHKSDVKDYVSRGGKLSARNANEYFHFLEYELFLFSAEGKRDRLEDLSSIRFLRRQIATIAVISAPPAGASIASREAHYEDWLKVTLLFDEYEKELTESGTTEE